MGMESFGQEEEVVAPVERIDDVEKAEAMAHAGDSERSAARVQREIAGGDAGYGLPENGFRTFGSKSTDADFLAGAEKHDEWANQDEEAAGKRFDEAKKVEGQE